MESEQEPVSSGVTQEPGGLSVRPAVNVFVRPSARSSTLAESTFRWWVDGWTDGQTFVMPQPMPCVLCGGVFSPLSEASPSPLPPSFFLPVAQPASQPAAAMAEKPSMQTV